MTDFQAAIGISQLEGLDRTIKMRNDIANQYGKELESVNLITMPSHGENRKHTYQTYHVLLDEKTNRDHIIHELKDNGIEANFGAHAIQCLTYYKRKYNYRDEDYPQAFRASRMGLALPIGCHVGQKDISFLCDVLKEMRDR
jgi:dTDP-4-amino-4,6-dideoxygalactose transaminase